MHMPDMDGLEATRRLRERTGRQPWIVAVTASALLEDRVKCVSAGMDAHVSKPVTPAKLQACLQQQTGKRMETDAPVSTATPTQTPLTDKPTSPAPATLGGPAWQQLCRLETNRSTGLLGEMQTIFEEEMERLLSQLADDADPQRVARIAHAINGAAANVGALALQELAQQVEQAARDGQVPAHCRAQLSVMYCVTRQALAEAVSARINAARSAGDGAGSATSVPSTSAKPSSDTNPS